MLEFENISKSFDGPAGKIQVLNSISFSISAGELVSIQGPSGCGKTTLLLIAGGLLNPNDGKVLIDGKNPYQLGTNPRSRLRAEKVGFVFQQFYLVPYLSVLENVLAPSLAKNARNIKSRAHQLIDHFNLRHRINHVPNQLSTGECQRTALARALLNEPKIILADEPTGNLDDENGKVVLDCLAEFAENGGAVLVVTHDSRVSEFAHKEIKLIDGAIV